jgi:hypothetical protein
MNQETLLAEIEADVADLLGIVGARWEVLPDPFGAVMLLPMDSDADVCPVDELPWPDIVARFRDTHGRLPRPGARALAARRLTSLRPVGGGLDA